MSKQTSEVMKNLTQSIYLNNFSVHCQFAKDISVELLKGNVNPEFIKVLEKNIEGIEDFLEMLKEKIKEKNA